jgi:hypothetical protein
MIPNDKLAYVNSLIKSMEFNPQTNEGKLFVAIADALNEMSEILEGYDEAFDGIAEVIADVEESVYELEDEVFGDCRPELDDYDSLDDDIYDITCASCDKTITVDYDALDSGSVKCPSCGETIEFTLEDE